MLSIINETGLFVLALACFLAVTELSFRLGFRHRQRSDEPMKSHVSALQAAVLGLLALLLGFNFAMAASRFDTRRNLLQEEVNSVHHTYLQSQLLPEPYQQQFTQLLQNYVNTRIQLVRAGVDSTQLEQASRQSAGIEGLLWSLTKTMVNQDKSGTPKDAFIQSLTEMIKVTANRRASIENHVPEVVLHVLFIVAVVAMGFIGYGAGLTGRRLYGASAILALLIAIVLVIILDLDRPRSGLIRIGDVNITKLETLIEQKAP